jgi:uncharacterized protein YcfJ
MFNTKWIVRSALAAGMGLAVVGCESHAGTDALVGGAAGAGIGALVGSMSHARAGEGALIGGAIGAVGGAIVGHEQDRREQYHDRYSYDDRYYRERPVVVRERVYEERPVVVRERRVYRYEPDCPPPGYDYRR